MYRPRRRAVGGAAETADANADAGITATALSLGRGWREAPGEGPIRHSQARPSSALRGPSPKGEGSRQLRSDGHSHPIAVLLFPVVARLTVHFVQRGVR